MLKELFKITQKLYIRIIIAVIMLITIWWSVTAIHKVSYSDEKGNIIYSGVDAAKKTNEEFQKIQLLTPQVLNEALLYYQKCCDEESDAQTRYYRAEYRTDKAYPGILRIISRVYFPDEYGTNYENLYKLDQVNDFYDMWTSNLSQRIQNRGITQEDANNIINKIQTPFRYGYYTRWRLYDSNISILYMLIAFAVIFICADDFSYERKCYMDKILISSGKKNYCRLIRNKLLAYIMLITILFFVCLIFETIGFWWKVGMPSLDCPIQIVYPMSLLNITVGQHVILFIIAGWISVLSLGVAVFTLNLYGCGAIKSIMISGFTYYFPGIMVLLNGSNRLMSNFVEKIIINQPIMNCLPKKTIPSISVIHIGDLIIPNIYSSMAISLVYLIILCVLIVVKTNRMTRKVVF